MIPAKRVASAVPMVTNPRSQLEHFGSQLVRTHPLQVIIHETSEAKFFPPLSLGLPKEFSPERPSEITFRVYVADL